MFPARASGRAESENIPGAHEQGPVSTAAASLRAPGRSAASLPCAAQGEDSSRRETRGVQGVERVGQHLRVFWEGCFPLQTHPHALVHKSSRAGYGRPAASGEGVRARGGRRACTVYP